MDVDYRGLVEDSNEAAIVLFSPSVQMKPAGPKLSKSRKSDLLPDWRFLATASAIVVVALLLRLYHIGAQEFWLDEALSFHTATMPNWLGAPLIENNTPPLYYLLLREWMPLAGQSEASIRLLSAVFGTIFVAMVIWAGREIFDPRVGLWSGLIAAVAPIHIYYSQEARAYALLTLALLATYATLWRALKTNLWRWWALFSLSSLVAFYSHYFAILGLLPTVYLLLVWPEKQQATRTRLYYGAAALASGLVFLPWLILSFIFSPHTLPLWMRNIWEQTPPLLAIPKSLEVLGLGSQAGLLPTFLKQFSSLEFPLSFRLLGIAIIFLIGLWVAIPQGDRRLNVPDLGRRKAFLGMALFFPLVVLWLVSFHRPFYVVGRYDIMAFPAYSLLLGLGLTKIQSAKKAGPILAFLAALALFVPIGAKLILYYQIPSDRLSQSTAITLHESVRNGDPVVFVGPRGLLIMYYMNRLGYRWQDGYCRNEMAGRRFPCRFIPQRHENRLTSAPSSDPIQRREPRENIDGKVEELVRSLLPQEGVLWVVFEHTAILSDREVISSRPNVRLARELQRLGLKAIPLDADLGIFQFRRS